MKRTKAAAMLLVAALAVACELPREPAEVGPLSVAFLDIGKADAVLITMSKHAVLIDAGLEESADAILGALGDRGVAALDTLIITHFDKDHVGAAGAVLDAVPVGRVIQAHYPKGGDAYLRYIDALETAGIEPESPDGPIEFALGETVFRVDPPLRDDYDEENDFSLVVTVRHGDHRFFFAGDAEAERVDELMTHGLGACDVLKVPHHGRHHRNSDEMIRRVSPEYAVITCSLEDPPEEILLRLLDRAGVRVYRTDDGEVIIESDGYALSVSQRTAGTDRRSPPPPAA